MKAPRPLQSPSAQMCGTLVLSVSSTTIYPCASTATPAASSPRSSVFGRRPTARSTCEPTTAGSPLLAIDADLDVRSARGEADAFGVKADRHAFGLQDRLDRVRHLGVLAGDQARRLFDHRDLGAEPAEDLGELEPDIAAADDHEMARQAIEFEQRRVGQRADLIDAREVRDHGAAADIDEDLAGLEGVASDLDRVGRDEPRVSRGSRCSFSCPAARTRGPSACRRQPDLFAP